MPICKLPRVHLLFSSSASSNPHPHPWGLPFSSSKCSRLFPIVLLPGIFFFLLSKYSSTQKCHFLRRSFPDCPHPSQSTWHFWLLIDQNMTWLFNVSIPLDGKTQEAGMRQFWWSVTELSSSSGAYLALHICSVSRLPTGPYISWRAHILWKSPLVAEITSMYWHAISPHQLCLLWRWIPDELQLV